MKLEKIGEGRYIVRRGDGLRVPGLILGGRRRWLVEIDGRTSPVVYGSRFAAADALRLHSCGGEASRSGSLGDAVAEAVAREDLGRLETLAIRAGTYRRLVDAAAAAGVDRDHLEELLGRI